MANVIRGTSKEQELDPRKQVRDTRSMGEKLIAWFRIPSNVAVFMAVLIGITGWYQWVTFWTTLIGLSVAMFALKQEEWAPNKIPKQAKIPDPNQLKLGTENGGAQSDGIFFLANEFGSGKEIWLTNSDCRQHFLVLGTTGAGKASSKNTQIFTPSGWRRMGDIKVGDRITTPFQSEDVRVNGVYEQGRRQLWRMTFGDGRVATIDGEHLWEVYHAGQRRVLTTQDIRSLKERTQDSVSILVSDAVNRTPQEITFSPYARGFSLDPAHDVLDDMVLQGSLSQRIALFQGLMDASGTCDAHTGTLLYKTPLKALAQNIQSLSWSLGGTASLSVSDSLFCVHICLKDPQFAFTIPEKQAWVTDIFYHPNLTNEITQVEPLEVYEDCVCLMIDHPRHLYIMDDYVVTHNTEALIGFAANALSWGSGFLFCDGKGDVSLFAKMYALCRRFGREDDLLVLNFMTGNSDVAGGDIKSNTLNPFATGSSDGLTQMIVSLMDDAGGDGAMWKGRATAMLTGVMRALCWLRSNGLIDLNVGTIRDYMSLKMIIELGKQSNYPDMDPEVRVSINSYLTSLPGFVESKGANQAQTTLDQHGYLEMQFTKILGSLADVYGHIFKTPYGEVDMYDVVLGRRVLVIMLPALEKAPDEIANIGKIIIATLKGMMGATLGARLDGTWDEVVENRPTNSPSPFIVVLDEVGYYTVEGLALCCAQARSLGFCMVLASQDIPAMEKRNEKEAASIIANTNTKIFMRLEEPNKTADLAIKRAGKALRARTGGSERESSEFFGSHYRDQKSTNFEDTDRIHLTDLTQQSEGEMHIVIQGRVIRGRSFYADAPSSLDVNKLTLGANHFVQVEKPHRKDLEDNQKIPEILERLMSADFIPKMRQENQKALDNIRDGVECRIAPVIKAFRQVAAKSSSNDVEAGCASLYAYHQSLTESVTGFGQEVSKTMGLHHSVRPDSTVQDEEDEDNDSRMMQQRRKDRMDKRQGHVRGNVSHGVKTPERNTEMVGRDIVKNESVLKTMAHLDYADEDEDFESSRLAIDEAIRAQVRQKTKASTYDDDEEDDDENDRLTENLASVNEILSATHETSSHVEKSFGESFKGGKIETDDEDEDEGGEGTEDFLNTLLNSGE